MQGAAFLCCGTIQCVPRFEGTDSSAWCGNHVAYTPLLGWLQEQGALVVVKE